MHIIITYYGHWDGTSKGTQWLIDCPVGFSILLPLTTNPSGSFKVLV